jgi:hypothetical protein
MPTGRQSYSTVAMVTGVKKGEKERNREHAGWPRSQCVSQTEIFNVNLNDKHENGTK